MPRCLRPLWGTLAAKVAADEDTAELASEGVRALRKELGDDEAVTKRLLAWHAELPAAPHAVAARELLRKLPHTALLSVLAIAPTAAQVESAAALLEHLADRLPREAEARARARAALRLLTEQVLSLCPAVGERLRGRR